MDIDNVTVCYQAIQRIYRNAVVEKIRDRFTEAFGDEAISRVMAPFQHEWQEAASSAAASRASGELSAPIRDAFDVLGVNHFYNLFDAQFDVLFPAHLSQPKKEKTQAKQAILGWARTIKNLRDPLSHPAEADFGIDDARQMLFCARNILDALQAFGDAEKVASISQSLDQNERESTLVLQMPPSDEVVTHFIGRKAEMLHLRRWIDDASAPRWALAGDGGKGKSAIAYTFANEVAQCRSAAFDAVIWLSAKKRRFVQGQTIQVDQPDFFDRASVVDALLRAYGEDVEGDTVAKEGTVVQYVKEFPSLIVIDDIDTLDGEGLGAVEFLVDLPVRTKSKLLITSRRVLFGLEMCTTTVTGLRDQDCDAFICSRCELMGIRTDVVMPHSKGIRDATDASPLFIEDLLRLTLAGLSVQQAVGLWQQRRGEQAREYAVLREFEQLPDDGKDVLFVLSLMDRACTFDELRTALGWHPERLLDAQQSLRQMFLMPKQVLHEGGGVRLSLNSNTKLLVHSVFSKSDRFNRTRRQVMGVLGKLETSNEEDSFVWSRLNRARTQVSRLFRERLDPSIVGLHAIEDLIRLEEKYPGRSDIPATIGYLNKRIGRMTDAREAFRRSAFLNCRDFHAYWHWADLEASQEEWAEAIRVAEEGLKIAPSERTLMFCLGYALRACKEIT